MSLQRHCINALVAPPVRCVDISKHFEQHGYGANYHPLYSNDGVADTSRTIAPSSAFHGRTLNTINFLYCIVSKLHLIPTQLLTCNIAHALPGRCAASLPRICATARRHNVVAWRRVISMPLQRHWNNASLRHRLWRITPIILASLRKSDAAKRLGWRALRRIIPMPL